MAGAYSLDALKSDVSKGLIDTVLVAFPDMQGRLIGKRFQAQFFLDGAIDETHGCDYLLANDIDMEPVPGYQAANWAKGYGDFVMKPDVSTLMKAAWLDGTAIILADLVDHHQHQPIPHSPRAILKGQLARLEKMGFTANFASELEFYLFDETFRGAYEKGYRNLTTAGYYIEDYHIFQTTKEEGVMRLVRNQLQASGIPVENSKGEWGPGQEEINVRYAEALTMA
ncbi:MAG: glutamine synthetase, partial [Devosia nanyangense]|nr:glutamine synthetase [Devosia nanyangense]